MIDLSMGCKIEHHTCFADGGDGDCVNKEELINALKVEYENFSTHCMNSGILELQGQKKMLGEIIRWMETI